MTSTANAIDQVSRTWALTQESLTIVRREIRRQNNTPVNQSRILARTSFEEGALSDIESDIAACKQAAEDYAIIAMWAVFERRLIARLEDECKKMQGNRPSEFNQLVFEELATSVERWQIDKVLDLIKPMVGGDLVGQAKNIKKYRDWIAHRNPRKTTPARVDAQTARELLKIIATALEAVEK